MITRVKEKCYLEVDDFVADTVLSLEGNDVLRLHVHMVDLVLDQFSQCFAGLQEIIKHIFLFFLLKVLADIERIILVINVGFDR